MRPITRALAALTGLIAAGALAPAAMGAITPSLSLGQSAGTTAGGYHDTGLNFSFSGDTPHNLTIDLPPGALANASVNGGKCLTESAASPPDAACKVGGATVAATAGALLPVPITVGFYLVKPPAAGDLAGLEVYTSDLGLGQLGPVGDVAIRPSGNPLGVGLSIKLSLPNTAKVAGISAPITINSIASTFSALRYPTTCPATPQKISGTVDGYSSPAVAYSAPLTVTGCSGLAFAPRLSAAAARDASDNGVALTTTITQQATEAPDRDVSLAFPPSTFAANLNALTNLCTGDVSRCTPVGSVSATSPLYPSALSGKAYLTGSARGLGLTLTFPSPFPITLTGAVDLDASSASFTGLPDLPLTNLKVSLNGGSSALFGTTCQYPSGTASAAATDQNGDKTAKPTAAVTVSGCPPSSGGSAGGGGGSTGGGTSVGPTSTARIVSSSASGLATGKPSLRFRVRVGSRAATLTRLTVALPKGLSVVRHRVGKKKRLRVTGVSLKGAKVRSLAVSHKRLVITFKRPSRNVLVTLGPKSLKVSRALATSARKHRLKRLTLKVIARNTAKKNTTITTRITALHL